jgi:hypothetical protein
MFRATVFLVICIKLSGPQAATAILSILSALSTISVTILTTSGLPLIISKGYLREEDEFDDEALFSISKILSFLGDDVMMCSSVGTGTFSKSEREVVEGDVSGAREVDERVA